VTDWGARASSASAIFREMDSLRRLWPRERRRSIFLAMSSLAFASEPASGVKLNGRSRKGPNWRAARVRMAHSARRPRCSRRWLYVGTHEVPVATVRAKLHCPVGFSAIVTLTRCRFVVDIDRSSVDESRFASPRRSCGFDLELASI